MSWKLRHAGSPREVGDLTLTQVVEGLQDGLWEPTDEVLGSSDSAWTALENQPQLAEIVADLQPPEASRLEDETRLDMTALIDVTLVLLIFFILATSYQKLERILDMPSGRTEDLGAIKQVRPEEVDEFMIQVKVRQVDGRPAYWVEDKQTAEGELLKELNRYARASRKNELLLDAAGVDYGTVVKVIDAAGGARIDKVHFKTERVLETQPSQAR